MSDVEVHVFMTGFVAGDERVLFASVFVAGVEVVAKTRIGGTREEETWFWRRG